MSQDITDRFGRVFTPLDTDDGFTKWTADDGSISVSLPASRSREAVQDTLEAMAPEQPPQPTAAPTVPDVVSNFQARAVLITLPGSLPGATLLDDVNAWVQAQGGIAYQAWEYGIEVRRDSALIAAAGLQFGLSNAELDQLFIAAATISV